MSALATLSPLEGEIMPPLRGTDFVFSPSAFRRGKVRTIQMPRGATLMDAVDALEIGPRLRQHLGVYINEHRIDPALWRVIRPKPDAMVYIRVELAGGGGDEGSGEKNPWRTILMIVVAIIAVYTGQYWALGAEGSLLYTASSFIITAGIMMAGAALVNALIPPPKSSSQYSFDQQPGNPYASITGIRNQMAPYAPIPRVIGKRRLFPMLAARPYTVSSGRVQNLRMLLLVGYGPLKITELCIGNTPIGAFAQSTYQIREGWPDDVPQTLYTKQIAELQLSAVLYHSAAQTRVSDPGATEISIDITFPQGLANINKTSGHRSNRTVEFSVEWRPTGSSYWHPAVWISSGASRGENGVPGAPGRVTATAASAVAEIRSGRFKVQGGTTYDVRITRLTANSTSISIVDLAYWTVLRSIQDENPVNMTGVTLIALDLRATEQLHGAPDTINCVAESYLPIYDAETETWTTELTRNPSWGTLDILRRRGQSTLIADERIDLQSFADFAAACDAPAPASEEPYWQADIVLEGGAVTTAAQLIASSGRGQLALVDGRFAVVRDELQTVPVQVITPRNSWGYRGFKAFFDIPHAFRVTFYNPDMGYAMDEVVVYRDGYAEDDGVGVVAATKFETLDLPACTSASQAWREGRYHFAVLLLRPEEHVVNMDIENLRCTKGAFVRFSHDVISVGLLSGRVICAAINDDDEILGLTVDNAVTMEAGTDYVVRIRHNDFTSALHPVVLEVAENQNYIRLITPVPLADWPLAQGATEPGGELYTFGELGVETLPAKVKSVMPGPNLTARLVLVDAQDGVHSADSGAIPEFNTHLTRGGVPVAHIQPEPPTITLRSDENVLLRAADGTLQDRIEVTHLPPPPSDVEVTRWEMESRRNATNEDWSPTVIRVIGLPAFITDVVPGELWDVRARFISRASLPSEWTYQLAHEVVGKTTPPGPVTDFTADAELDFVALRWNAPADAPDMDGYEIRFGGADWDAATIVGRVPHLIYSTAQGYSHATSVVGGETYRIKGFDVLNLASTEVTAVVSGRTTAEGGRITDWRGTPTNGLGGSGIARSAPSINGGGPTGITIDAVTLYVPGEGTVALPSDSFSGLTGGTKYYVFYDRTGADYVAESTYADAAAKMNDATGRYIYVGARTPGGGVSDSDGVGEIP